MYNNFSETHDDLIDQLERNNIKVSKDAMKPLKRLNFRRMVEIHDHEEAFLRNVFIDSLISARKARIADGTTSDRLTASDVRTAMLILGAAIRSASENNFSGSSKSIIIEACPYC